MRVVKVGVIVHRGHVLDGVGVGVDLGEEVGADDVGAEVARVEREQEEGGEAPQAGDEFALAENVLTNKLRRKLCVV